MVRRKKLKKVLLLVMFSLIVLTMYNSTATSSTLCIVVKTSKSSYQVGEKVYVYGNLTYQGLPAPEWLVAIEVQDPSNHKILLMTRQTDAEGAYNLTFRLPIIAKLGTYTVTVTSLYMGEVSANSTTFEACMHGNLMGEGGSPMPPLICDW